MNILFRRMNMNTLKFSSKIWLFADTLHVIGCFYKYVVSYTFRIFKTNINMFYSIYSFGVSLHEFHHIASASWDVTRNGWKGRSFLFSCQPSLAT